MKRPKNGAKLLKDAMRQKRLSPYAVAFNLGITHQAVYQWLAGRTIPTLKHAVLMSEQLAIPVDAWS